MKPLILAKINFYLSAIGLALSGANIGLGLLGLSKHPLIAALAIGVGIVMFCYWVWQALNDAKEVVDNEDRS